MDIKHTIFFVWVVVAVGFSDTVREKNFRIVATGETHAMLYPCDCPHEPDGGFARRGQIIRSLRDSADIVLVDAGGFSGGSVYDQYTEGRVRDSIRTVASIAAMAAMRYDAVAVGDDDLLYGASWLAATAARNGLPLVSANVLDSAGNPVVAPLLFFRRNGIPFGITAVTTTERLVPLDQSVTVADPITSLQALWDTLSAHSDIQIVLSHTGEHISADIARTFPGATVVVNGHRKKETKACVKRDGVPIMQFGFQGKKLSVAAYSFDRKKKLSLGASQWIDLPETVPGDPAIDSILGEYDRVSPPTSVFDLYIMSKCPYGRDALEQLRAFVQRFPPVEWNVWFIGSVGPDSSFSSLHGESEVADELLWLGVKNTAPEQWSAFLDRRVHSERPTEEVIRQLDIDPKSVRRWIERRGKRTLALHYSRSERMDISASPTLLVNNTAFEREITVEQLAYFLCARQPGAGAYCDSVPECLTDNDCIAEGKIGLCVEEESGKRCRYRDDIAFDFIALLPDSSRTHPETEVIATTRSLFPGVRIREYTSSSRTGKALIEKLSPPALPFYLFAPEVKKAYNFEKVADGLIYRKKWYLFKPGVIKKQYLYTRPAHPGEITCYIDPFFPDLKECIETIVTFTPENTPLNVKPIVRDETGGETPHPERRARREEAMRWLTFRRFYPDSFLRYLHFYANEVGSSYWFMSLDSFGIDIDEFVANVTTTSASAAQYRRQLAQMGINGPIEVVFDNREIVAVRNNQHLIEILSSGSPTKPGR
jgi:hypothetical protein